MLHLSDILSDVFTCLTKVILRLYTVSRVQLRRSKAYVAPLQLLRNRPLVVDVKHFLDWSPFLPGRGASTPLNWMRA